jgi:hypothetical protein
MRANPYRSERTKAWRNMMVAAVSDALASAVFDLPPVHDQAGRE